MKTKKKKILFITTDFPPLKGGIASWAWEEYKKLKRKYNVILLVKENKKLTNKKNLFYFKNEKNIKKIVKTLYKKYKFEHVIFFHWETARSVFLWLKLKKIPYTIVIHGWAFLRPRSFYTEFVKSLILKFADEIQVTSPYMKEKVIKKGAKPEKVKIVLIPVDKRKFKKFEKTQINKLKRKYKVTVKKIILSVGRLVKRKDFITVLKAVKLLERRNKNILYVIIGEGPYRREIESFINKNRLKKYVEMRGEVSDGELVEWYNMCDVFVLTPVEIKEDGDIEGFGIVYFEASFCGKPVVGSKTGGVPFALSHIKNSFLIEPQDYKSLAQLLKNILKI